MNRRWAGVTLVVFVVMHASSAAAEVFPQVSYSVALGRSGEQGFAHMWLGAGLHSEPERAKGWAPYALLGVELEKRFGDAPMPAARAAAQPRMTEPEPDASQPSSFEAWLSTRLGTGHFRRRFPVPHTAMYVVVARRFAGDPVAPRQRYGIGWSAPALLRFAEIGVPTMIELGVDRGGHGGDVRAFARAGWNF